MDIYRLYLPRSMSSVMGSVTFPVELPPPLPAWADHGVMVAKVTSLTSTYQDLAAVMEARTWIVDINRYEDIQM